MTTPLRILLQTTIPATEDDWHIGRFSLLQRHLAGLTDEAGNALATVEARDRADPTGPDPVLSRLAESDFDELWLFAVDEGGGLLDEDCEGIARFRARGGGLLVTRDHMDLGSSVRGLAGIGAAHYFHSYNPDPDPNRCCRDDIETADISWPNYHSGANGDMQTIRVEGAVHPVLADPAAPQGHIRFFPAHPHEGGIGIPPSTPNARVIATGTSRTTGTPFNLAIAFEGNGTLGRGIAQSTFHHFADYNWDPAMGAPSFVTERPGCALSESLAAQADIRRYATNLALWLGGRDTAAPAAPLPVAD